MTTTRRILLVEDEKAIRDAVSAYLEKEGYWVTTAADGVAASLDSNSSAFLGLPRGAPPAGVAPP